VSVNWLGMPWNVFFVGHALECVFCSLVTQSGGMKTASDLARNVTQDKIQHYPVVSFLPGAEGPVGQGRALAVPCSARGSPPTPAPIR
jgi:hypothetical protein